MNKRIQRFHEINEFFETTGFEKRTDIPQFFIFKLEELPSKTAWTMPPYQKDFYQISLILNADQAEIGINEQENKSLDNTLYFLSPDHVFWWQRRMKTTGFVVYFKADFFHFFNGNFNNEFPFFDLAASNFLELDTETSVELALDFDKLYKEYYTPNHYRIQIIQSFLLSLLFKFKSMQEIKNTAIVKPSKKQDLVVRFQNLVANCYLTKKQVGDYADLLFVSANTLNQQVKEITGKTAKQIIADKMMQEAKKQLRYTTDDVGQIAYNLGFDEPTHFIRFFKTQTTMTPNEYRKTTL